MRGHRARDVSSRVGNRLSLRRSGSAALSRRRSGDGAAATKGGRRAARATRGASSRAPAAAWRRPRSAARLVVGIQCTSVPRCATPFFLVHVRDAEVDDDRRGRRQGRGLGRHRHRRRDGGNLRHALAGRAAGGAAATRRANSGAPRRRGVPGIGLRLLLLFLLVLHYRRGRQRAGLCGLLPLLGAEREGLADIADETSPKSYAAVLAFVCRRCLRQLRRAPRALRARITHRLNHAGDCRTVDSRQSTVSVEPEVSCRTSVLASVHNPSSQ